MNRREFLKQSGLGLAALTLAQAPRTGLTAPAAGAAKPDVLLIMIEGTPPTRLGTWGNKTCKTPNLDRLASQGLRFDLAHCMAPPCNPARTSLLLGLRPESTQTFGNATDWRPLHPGVVTMPEYFKNNGYETIECGKIFHEPFDAEGAWSRRLSLTAGLPARGHQARPLGGPDAAQATESKAAKRKARKAKAAGKAQPEVAAATAKAATAKAAGGEAGVPFIYGPSGLDDIEEHDGMVAEQGVRLLSQQRDGGKPLFLALGFTRPHLPYSCPDKYFAMYPPEKIELPENPDKTVPKHADQLLVDDKSWREAIAAFYACLTFADVCIGRVLDALEKSGRAGSTIVVFMADHGYMLGDHYQWRKGQLYEEGVVVPMIIKAPGVTQPATICKRPVECVDVFPTLFDLCGIPQPPKIEAISMKPLLQNPARPWKKGAIALSGEQNVSIRTERWRYWEYNQRGSGKKAHNNFKVALFDHQNDPGEFKNLAEDPQYKDVVAEMHALIQGGWKGCLPPE